MNANELADELESCKYYELPSLVHKICPMLRYQQDEIDALRQQLKYLEQQVYGGKTK